MRVDRQRGRALEAWIDVLVDALDHRGDGRVARVEAREDRALAQPPMVFQRAQVARRVLHGTAVPGPVDRFAARLQLCDRGHVIGHRSVGRRHDRG